MGLEETMEMAREAWEGRWHRQPGKRERYTISFDSSWGTCGEVMQAMATREVCDIAWTHIGRTHRVDFTCDWDTLKYVQGVLKRMPADGLRCTRAAVGGGRDGE